MDLSKMLAELKSERDQIDQVIIALTPLAQGRKRRGRPPLWLSAVNAIGPKKRRGRTPKNKPKYPDVKTA